ncbi:class A beta-lactamase-related serine hydrolase [Streptomyces sp. NBC_00056]|uniref:serine hydrolase n=1 Tax=unclassified Streptomyces TaxID=2593676 RepID=UPI00225531CA|nr:serine hydrolase [Streptomyces sp. NBC_00063]MCX5442303.1 class A beta-lactamase-related serine hydrolase [Streptomyces sp. NBC_00063]
MHMPLTRRAKQGLAAALAAGSALTAFAAGVPAQAGAVAGTSSVEGSPVTCTSHRPGLADRLERDIATALHGHGKTSALALYDRTTGTSCTFRASTAFDSASVVKVAILGALLRQAAEEHRLLTSREVDLTTDMITKSDNAATNALWHQIGHTGIQHFLDLAGMRDTVPGRKGTWGLTQITAGDQVKLLRLLTSDNHVLGERARAYALRLMNRVVPDQRWGTPAGAPGTATVHVKNGWLQRSANGWRVNSVGVFTGGGHDYGMAVLSHGSRTMEDGVTTVERAARAVNRDLNLSQAS